MYASYVENAIIKSIYDQLYTIANKLINTK